MSAASAPRPPADIKLPRIRSRRTHTARLAVSILPLLLSLPSAASAATVYATPAGGGSGASCTDGTSAELAIAAAGAGDTVHLCAGTFAAPALGLSITANNVTVEGEGPTATIVDGTGVLSIQAIFGVAHDAAFRNLAIRNHTQDGAPGAGIYAYANGVISVSGSTFSNLNATGSSSDGGAIYAGKAVIATSTFSGNSARNRGGAIFTSSSTADSLTVSDSTFSGNEARDSGARGGAVYSAGGVVATDARFLNNTVVLEGTTGAYLEGGGAAIWANGTAQLERSTVDGNSTTAQRTGIGVTAARGGGIYADAIDLAESTLSDNSIVIEQPVAPDPPPSGYNCWANTSSAFGGGAFFASTLTANKARIEDNLTKTIGADYAEPWGGGVGANLGATSATFVDSTLSGNSAVVTTPGCIGSNPQGGAMRIGQSVTLNRSTVSGNTSPANGGGMWVQSLNAALPTSVTARNSTFSGNQASSASVIFASGEAGTPSDIELENVTVAANTATGVGGRALVASTGRLHMTNTIVADEGGCSWDTIVSPALGGGGNVISDGSGSCDAFAAEPLGRAATPAQLVLGGLADNGGPTRTMALSAGSAAIAAGVPAACPVTDQRGIARPASACDSGAYQYVAPAPDPPAPGPSPGPGPGPGPGPSPSNSFTLRAPWASGPRLRAPVRVPGPGRLVLRATRSSNAAARVTACRASRQVSRAGSVVLTCRANQAARSAQRRGALRLSVTVTYTPTGGTARTSTARTVVLKSTRPAFTG